MLKTPSSGDFKQHLILQGWNYYFTPLGKSWVCVRAEDQGTLKLYNTDEEVIGNMTLYNIKVQPFVKRAKGKWGEELHCLPRHVQEMRENVVPYVMSLVFMVGICICVAAYGLYRQFFVKKTNFEVYDENGANGSGGGAVPMEEFTSPAPAPDPVQAKDENFANFAEQNEIEADNNAKPAPAANPFKKETNVTTNPFNK